MVPCIHVSAWVWGRCFDCNYAQTEDTTCHAPQMCDVSGGSVCGACMVILLRSYVRSYVVV